MKYNGNVYRPPLEANTFLIPITEGCTHNKCTFCNMYNGVPFHIISTHDIEEYIIDAKRQWAVLNDEKRVYLVGADPFALSANRLLERIEIIKRHLPDVEVITMYARIQNIMTKSDDDLHRLKEAGVNDLYIGIESGADEALEVLHKGSTINDAITQCNRLNKAGIRHSDLLMLGTLGSGRAEEAGCEAALLENILKPTQILVNTMSAFEGTALNDSIKSGDFVPATEAEILTEERIMLKNLKLDGVYFWAAHPLDSVSIAGTLGTDTERMIARLDNAIEHIDEHKYQRVSRTGTL